MALGRHTPSTINPTTLRHNPAPGPLAELLSPGARLDMVGGWTWWVGGWGHAGYSSPVSEEEEDEEEEEEEEVEEEKRKINRTSHKG